MSLPPKPIYQFASYSLDPEKRLLLRGEEPVPLPPKLLETLLVLVENRSRILTKDQLLHEIWGGTIVEEGGLARNVSILRKVLGERRGEHQYIVTVPGKGYKFVAEVHEVYESEEVAIALPKIVSEDLPRPRAVHSRHKWQMLSGLAALLVAAVIYLLIQQRHALATPPKINSLAVLPLMNLSGDPAQEYFADGITEALIGNLARIQALNVISRTSVMSFKNSQKSLPEIARELNVDAIIEGSVQRENGRVKIGVQLIEARTDAHLWAREYERDLTDVWKLQADVAHAIVEEIRVQVTPDERARMMSVSTTDPAAHEEYLLGRYYFWKFIPDDHKRAITHFERATTIDPTFAAAWAGLAQAWWQLGAQSERPLNQVEAPARASAAKALELDDQLAEAHVAQGFVRWLFDGDWRGAETSIRRAIDLDPGNVDAHFFYARLLMLLARFPEALTEIQITERLDPISSAVQSDFGQILYRSGNLSAAAARLERAIEREPRSPQAHVRLAEVYAQMGRFNESLELYEKARLLRGNPSDDPRQLSAIAEVYALMGRRNDAKRILADLRDQGTPAAYAILGERTEAFRLLFKMAANREQDVITVKADPKLKNLHADARWSELLNKLKLPQD